MTDKVAKKMSESPLNPSKTERGKSGKSSTSSSKRQSKSRTPSRESTRSNRRSSGM